MLALSNFNNYSRTQIDNYEGLNTLSTMFSLIFCVFNTLLGNLILIDFTKKAIATIIVYLLVFLSIFMTSFTFDNMQQETMIALGIAITFFIILIPAFLWLTQTIQDEIVM